MRWTSLLLCTLLLAGCGGKAGDPIPVTGTVKLADGSVPAGEITVVRFEPMDAGVDKKPASGTIKADGTYSLTTIKPNDGAYPGEYKVTFSIYKTYKGREEMLDAKFTKKETTPHSASVKKGSQKFDFVVEKAP